jgi:hypothetical protein
VRHQITNSSAPAEEEVGLADGADEPGREQLQHAVPRIVAVPIVDPLEVVDVQEDEGDALAQAAGAVHLAREELVEGAPVEASGQALAPGEAALAFPHPGEDGREDARRHREGRHEDPEVELHLPQPRNEQLPARRPRGGIELERLLEGVDSHEDQHRDEAEGDGGDDGSAGVGDLVVGRGRELVVDPGPRPRPGEAQERRHHEEGLQEVPDHPAAPDPQARRGVEAVPVVQRRRGTVMAR